MTCGSTDRAVLDFVIERAREHGHKPFEVLKESSGFIEFVKFRWMPCLPLEFTIVTFM
jgi:hypothetical protein